MKKLSLVLMLVLFGVGSMLAQRTVQGTVTSEDGEPLIGASVLVKGTSVGTVTDYDGKYSLTVPEGSNTLVFSYTGYETQEVELGVSNVVDVVMAEGITLETAVVTALGVQREEKAVGFAVQEVDSKAIERSGASKTLDALRGKAAGVNIIRASGAAGGGTRIVIRGQTSLTGDNQALIVIDGVRVNNSTFQSEGNHAGVANTNRLADLNPNDIESISILKGAAATALYGVDGARGVVVITTKRGKGTDGKKFKVDVNSSVTFSEVTQITPTQNTYAQGWAGVYSPPGPGFTSAVSWGPPVSELAWDGATDYEYDPNGRIVPKDDSTAVRPVVPYDNIGTFFQTGIAFSNNIAVSGGSDVANFRLSYGNYSEEGVVPKNTFTRNTFKLASDLKLTDRLSMAASANFTKSNGRRIQQGSNTSGLMLGLLRTPVTFDNSGGFDDPANTEAAYRFPDGTQRNYRGGGGYDNPYWVINLAPRFDEVNRLFGHVSLEYKLHPWATFSANLGTDWYSDRREQQFEINSRTAPSGRVFEDNFFFRNTDFYFNLRGNGNLTDDITMGYLLGSNLYSSHLENLYTQGDGLSFQDFVHISNASDVQSSRILNRSATVGFYGSIDLGWKGLVYLTATGRQDYVSTLIVPGQPFSASDISFFYPSASLSFVFSELLPNDDILSFGKLRLSYAEVGGGPPGAYATSTVFTQASAGDGWADPVSFPFNGITGFTQSDRLGNPLLEPERTVNQEVGLDLRFFKGRLGLDVSYYTMLSENQILPVDLAGTTGYTSAVLNTGTLSNEGFEVVLTASPIRKRDFGWDLQVNFDRYRSIVEKLAENLEALQIGGFTGTGMFHIAGQPFGVLYGGAYLRYNDGSIEDDGLTIIDGPIQINDDPTSNEYGYQQPDGTLRVIGDPNPDFTVGITNTFTYKRLALSFLIDWKQGGDMWNGTMWALTFFGRAQITAEDRDKIVVFDGVLSDGSPNNIPVRVGQNYWTSSVGGFGSVDESFVQSTTWVRLREITLSWDFDPKWFSGTFVQGGSLVLNGRNLYFWTPYLGVDPETSLWGTGNAQGFEYFNMPATRSVSVGLNLSF